MGANPRSDPTARQRFDESAKALWVAPAELDASLALLNRHEAQRRPRERDNALATRCVALPTAPSANWLPHDAPAISPMAAIDAEFVALVSANPHLRPRVGNPDELRSNHMNATLDLLEHRVFVPEAGLAEAVDGAVITALNEEAVMCAALGNKGGIRLVVTYEAFAVKMLGALRQDILFARRQIEVGQPPGWLSQVTVATSHTGENGKNEQSHQDPTSIDSRANS